jgi:hypothetical protein
VLGQTLWVVDLVLRNTTTIGRTIGAYKEVVMLGQALWVVAMVLRSKFTNTKIVDCH